MAGIAWLLMLAGYGHLHMGLQRGAAREHFIELHRMAEEEQQALIASREALYASHQELGPEMGRKIFEERCTACHAFERRVVGPAYDTVIPAYGGDAAALVAFIKNPVKKNPDYPAMPKQGLTGPQIEAVARFLIDHYAAKENAP